MLDTSPADEIPFEDASPWPSGPITVEIDGSLTGCDRCHRRFALMDSYTIHPFAGRVTFRHVRPC